MDNLTDIKRARKRKAGDSEKPAKMSAADRYHAIMDAINGARWNQLPTFPCKLYLIEPEPGVKIVLKELEDEVVIQVNDNHVVDLILGYTQGELAGEEEYRFTVAKAKAARDYWLHSTLAIPAPELVRWVDEPGLTYRRMPWMRSTGPTPNWDELLGRMGAQAEAFMAWVGSLLVPESDRQQYLWLYGQGQNGKGAITRFLGRVFGSAFRSEIPPRPDDKFWTRNLLGARLVSFPDCNAAGFPASGLFKSLTGGDAVRMEIKGGASFTADIACKFMFSSNEKPTLSSEAADLRRPIFVTMEQIASHPDPSYEARLWDEGGYFLSNCLEVYDRMCPGHGRIHVDNEELLAHVQTLEERFATILATEFVVHPIEEGKMLRDYPFVSGSFMQKLYWTLKLNAVEQQKFLKYLEINYGIKSDLVRLDDGSRRYRYCRLEAKTALVD